MRASSVGSAGSAAPTTSTGSPGMRRGWTLALASLGAFMSALDVVAVSTALPTLRTQLGATLPDLEWTINAYSLVFGRTGRRAPACSSRPGWCKARAAPCWSR